MNSLKIGPVRIDYILFFVLFTGASLFLLRSRDIREQRYYAVWKNQATAEFRATADHRRQLANLFMERRVLTPRVAALLAEAGDGPNNEDRDRIREELLTLLAPDFAFFRDLGFELLHFHLPDQTSFLRFHAPDKFGDRLGTRENLLAAYRGGRPTEGFQAGPLFSGYSFVYPVRLAERTVGTVEIGMTLGTLQAELNRAYASRYRFLINAAAVQTLTVQREEFADSAIGPNFAAVLAPDSTPDEEPDEETIREIDRRIRKRPGTPLAENEDFSFQTRLPSGTFLATFLALREGENDASLYLAAYRKDDTLAGFRSNMLTSLILTICLLALSMALHLWTRKRIRRTAETLNAREEELAREVENRIAAEDSLEKAESRMDVLGRASMDGLILMDSAGRVASWNEAAEKIFGFAASEIMGKPLHDLVTPTRLRERARSRMEIFARTGEGRSIGRVVEFTALRKSGVEFPAYVSTEALRLEDRWWAVAAVRDIADQKRAEEQLLELQTTDSLTGLPNRSRFLGLLCREIARSRRYGRPLSLLLIDVDGFSGINRRHGRKVGDHVLRTLSDLIVNSVRTVDLTARLGDGEIGLLLTDTDLDQAEVAAERFRLRTADTLIPSGDEETAQFTISVGVAAMDDVIRDAETFMNRAESALSQAKVQGRDRVVRAEKSHEPIQPEMEPRHADAEPAPEN